MQEKEKVPHPAFKFTLINTKDLKKYYVGIGISWKQLPALIRDIRQYLSVSDQKAIQNYYEKRQHDFLIGRRALFNALQIENPSDSIPAPEVTYGVFGQPILADYDGEISITHSGKLGVAIHYPEEILMGIDIEVHQSNTNLSWQIEPSEEEIFYKSSLPETTRRLVAWTMKEALGKALKCGLGISLSSMKITTLNLLHTHPCTVLTAEFSEFHFFQCYTILSDKYIFSLALPKMLNFLKLEEFTIQLTSLLEQG